MEIVIAFAAKVVEYTVAPIGRQLGYLIFYTSNKENLRTQFRSLEETKDRVQREVDAAKRNGQEIHPDVQNWLSKVNELIEEATKLFGDEGRATTGCFSTGSCPNVLSRHQVSRKSTKLLLEVTEIQLKGNFSSVSYNPPPPPLTATLVTKDFKALDSRTRTLTEIMEKLKDPTIRTIGVWGPGGVGKTTLAKQVAKEVEESKMFGKVVMVTVTVNPDVRQIQGEIADALGLKFDQETQMRRGDTVKDPSVQPIAIEVVKRCAGLPVLIATVAKALKDEALYVWKDTLKQLELFDKEGMHEKVYSALELSYNHLKGQQIKSLFLLIALHGQHSVEKHDLSIISVGLGLFKNVDTLEDARNRLDKLTNDLKASCLLIEDGREEVKIHDLVREAGSLIAAEDQLFRIDFKSESAEWPGKNILENYRGLLLSVRLQSDLPERLECPELQVLALKSDEDILKLSDSFFEVMRKLKVLCLYHMEFTPTLPLSLHLLKYLKALYLYNCELADIAVVGEFRNLEILSIRDSVIENLPSEIGRLYCLKMLDLENCSRLQVIPPRVISSLTRLEELNMERSFTKWEVEGSNTQSCNSSLSELKELPNLKSLYIQIPDVQTLSADIFLFFQNLQRFKIDIGERVYLSADKYEYSQILTLEFSSSTQLENWTRMLLEKVEYLSLGRVNGVKKVFQDFSAKGLGVLRQLVHISISVCKSMKEIVMLETEENLYQGLRAIEFTELRSLRMDNLPELISFCSTKRTSSTSEADKSNPSLPLFSNKVSFPKLENLVLSKINMKQIWDDKFSANTCFPNLTVLRIRGCDTIEDMSPLASLVKLKHLNIRACLMVEVLLITKESSCEEVLFPNLESLTLFHMANMRTMWDGQVSSSAFSNVKRILVKDCAKLTTFLPLNIGKNFQNLDSLKVYNCNSLEMIFNFRELNDAKAHAGGIHCHLKYLTLRRLSKLMHIWNGDLKGIPIIFQDLQKVKVENCENLNNIFPGSIGKCFMQLEKLKIVSCGVTEIVAEDMDGSNEAIRFQFPKVKHVSLMWLPKLTSFFPGLMHTLEWPMLNELHVSNPNEAKIFSLQEVPNFQRDALEMQLSSGRKLFFSPKKEIVPNLESLYLEGNSAKIFYLNGQFQVLFHSIKILGVRDCSSLRSLVPATYSSTHFQNVHTLEIESCDELINLVALSTAKCALARLQKLSIKNCEKIEEIISSDHHGQDVEVDEIVFPLLKCLQLYFLPNLKSFCPEKCTLQFPSLKEVAVVACPNMEMFTPGVALTPLLSGVVRDKYYKFSKLLWEADLNNTISQIFTNMHEEMRKGFPKSIKHPLHEKHELVVAWGSYGCDGCHKDGDNWSYFCGKCSFDLHPTCALEGRNKVINKAGKLETGILSHVEI
ncbi:Disease resistance protein [Quillaja saponaria]|uniref:Disease resistance protein n=1 Tax=Quillaja saponaria TaxID=32244 RepID=A0AAD7LPC6_QUISA|nr:Disease resistance protein [Quillaja saponaria]